MTLDSTTREIQKVARRVSRLGGYVGGALTSDSVKKSRGVLYLSHGISYLYMYLCEPRTGRMWIRSWEKKGSEKEFQDSEDMAPDMALEMLLRFERRLRPIALQKARQDIINELAEKRVRLVLRDKTQGFKAPQKKRKHDPA